MPAETVIAERVRRYPPPDRIRPRPAHRLVVDIDRARFANDPQQNLEILDVYYNCLLLGFKGRYLIEGTELLDLLATRLRQEILLVKGGEAPFAPHARPSKRTTEFIRKSLPLWVYFSAFALLAALLWVTQKVWLVHHVGQARKLIG